MFQFKSKKKPGWCAVVGYPDRFDVVHARRIEGRKPQIDLLNSYRRSGDDVDAMKRLRKTLELQRYRCTTLLLDGDYQMFQVEQPAGEPGDLKAKMRAAVQEKLDFPIEMATYDVLDIPVADGSRGRSGQAFAVAASNAVLSPRQRLFDDAGIPLEAIDAPELAQRNIAALFEEENRGLALLAFSDTGNLLTFSYRGELYVIRHSDVSLQQLQVADDTSRAQIFERIALEVQRSLDNFDRLNSHIAISRVLVTPLPGVTGFVENLRQNLFQPVVELDLSEVLDFPGVPELRTPERQAQCFWSIGAALRD